MCKTDCDNRFIDFMKNGNLVKFALGFLLMWVAGSAFALPFNTDLYHTQPGTGDVMRPKAKNSVPLGSLERRVESKEEVETWQNPKKGDALSVLSGKRLFQVNCSPCHGAYSEGQFSKGPVAEYLPAPDLRDAMYKGRSDGNLFGTIHFGGMAIMPPYGWKLSISEHWDIVNYIRQIQTGK